MSWLARESGQCGIKPNRVVVFSFRIYNTWNDRFAVIVGRMSETSTIVQRYVKPDKTLTLSKLSKQIYFFTSFGVNITWLHLIGHSGQCSLPNPCSVHSVYGDLTSFQTWRKFRLFLLTDNLETNWRRLVRCHCLLVKCWVGTQRRAGRTEDWKISTYIHHKRIYSCEIQTSFLGAFRLLPNASFISFWCWWETLPFEFKHFRN